MGPQRKQCVPGKENSRRIIVRGDPGYPALLSVRLAGDAPLQLNAPEPNHAVACWKPL